MTLFVETPIRQERERSTHIDARSHIGHYIGRSPLTPTQTAIANLAVRHGARGHPGTLNTGSTGMMMSSRRELLKFAGAGAATAAAWKRARIPCRSPAKDGCPMATSPTATRTPS